MTETPTERQPKRTPTEIAQGHADKALEKLEKHDQKVEKAEQKIDAAQEKVNELREQRDELQAEADYRQAHPLLRQQKSGSGFDVADDPASEGGEGPSDDLDFDDGSKQPELAGGDDDEGNPFV